MKVLMAAVEEATTKNGAPFLRVQLVDEKKRSFPAVWFDPFEGTLGNICEVTLKEPSNPGYKTQITSLKVLPDEDKNLYLKRSPCDPEEVFQWFQEKTRDSGDITKIIDDIILGDGEPSARLAEVNKRFAEWPAARGVHHAFSGGLMEHTYAMGQGAEFFMNNDLSFQDLDAPLVYAAIFLHDLAKIREFDWKAPGPAEHTAAGVLLGHISMMDEAIIKSCIRLKISTTRGRVLALRHCILSHHGKKEWGSPVTPGTREATLVHQLDLIQSRGQICLEAMEGIAPGGRVYNAALDTVLFKFKDSQ